MATDTEDASSAISGRHMGVGSKGLVDVLEELAKASLDQKRTFQFSLGPKLLAYARGQQWLQETGNEDRYWQDNKSVHRERRVVMQMIRPRLRQYVSLLMRAKPGFTCQPRRSDDTSRRKSSKSNFFLDWFMEDSNAHQARWLATSSLATLGSGYVEPYFDPTRGKPIYEDDTVKDPLTDQPVMDDFLGQPMKLFKGGKKKRKLKLSGELGVNFYTPFEVFPPPGVRVPFVEMWSYVQVAMVLDEAEARRRYPKHASKIHSGTQPTDWGLDYASSLATLQASAYGKQGWGAQRSEGVVVFKYREAPSTVPGFEEGREIHWIPGLILQDGPLECPEAGLGIHGLYGDWEPGSALCQGLVESLTDVQDFMNRVTSRILRHMQLSLDPPLLAPIGSGITAQRMKQGYDKVIPFDALRGEPKWLQYPPIPSAMFALITLLEAQADRISAMQPLARGELSRGMPSGVLMQLIQEAQEGVLSQYAQLASKSWASFGGHVLSLASKSKMADYTVRVLGPQGNADFVDIAPGELEGVDVSCKEGSLLPRLKAARQVQVMERWGSNLYGPAQDPSVVAHVRKELDEPAVIDSSIPGEADRQYAEHEDYVMLKLGRPLPEGTPFDNGHIHMAEHILKTRTPGYVTLPEEVRNAHAQHIGWHQQQLEAADEAEVQKQLEVFKKHEMIKAEAAAYRTQAAMIANVMSAKAANAIRKGVGPEVGEQMLDSGAEEERPPQIQG